MNQTYNRISELIDQVDDQDEFDVALHPLKDGMARIVVTGEGTRAEIDVRFLAPMFSASEDEVKEYIANCIRDGVENCRSQLRANQ